jgi:hypothetical protein
MAWPLVIEWTQALATDQVRLIFTKPIRISGAFFRTSGPTVVPVDFIIVPRIVGTVQLMLVRSQTANVNSISDNAFVVSRHGTGLTQLPKKLSYPLFLEKSAPVKELIIYNSQVAGSFVMTLNYELAN